MQTSAENIKLDSQYSSPKKPPLIDVDYNSLSEIYSNPLFYCEETQDTYCYWTDGKKVYWLFREVTNDVENFVWFNDRFAKDSKHCFLQDTKLRQADLATFSALNNSYAKDKQFVWTLSGRFEPADIETFAVCDDGVVKVSSLQEMDDGTKRTTISYLPFGYAKDSQCVYYEDSHGKTKIIKKADPATFVSNNDGRYAWDAQFVFLCASLLPGADPQSWHIVDAERLLSKDAKRFYDRNKRITEEEWNKMLQRIQKERRLLVKLGLE